MSTFEIDYGAIPVLEDVTRQIVISNESLIPAEFICDMVGALFDMWNLFFGVVLYAVNCRSI